MKILILTDCTKLVGNIAKERCHLDNPHYIQYADAKTQRAKDIEQVRWDLVIVQNQVKGETEVLPEKWRKSIAKSCNALVYVN